MKIEAVKEEKETATGTAQPKKASMLETPEKKIERLCKKERWTAKDAGRFLFYVLEAYYSENQRLPGTEKQWHYFYSQKDRLLQSEKEAEKVEDYMDLYKFYISIHEFFNMNIEAFNRGYLCAYYLISFPCCDEEGECAIEKEMQEQGISFKGDPFDSFSDSYALYNENSADVFSSIMKYRVSPGWHWLTAWNIFTKKIGELYALKDECFMLCRDLSEPMEMMNKTNDAIKTMSRPENLSSHGEAFGVTKEMKADYIKEGYPIFDYKKELPAKDRVNRITEILRGEKAKHTRRLSETGQYYIAYLAGTISDTDLGKVNE